MVGLVEAGILNAIEGRRIREYGHGRGPESLVCRMFDGGICGKNRVDWRKIQWMDNISVWCDGLDSVRATAVEHFRQFL